MNIIQGKQVDTDTAKRFLNELRNAVNTTLKNKTLEASTVINAADSLSKRLNMDMAFPVLSALGRETAEYMVSEAKRFLSREYLETKLQRELGNTGPRKIDDNTYEEYRPLGVITHISAGNAAGLPAFSVLEGLLTGNINILKLPGEDDGLSTSLLMMLIETEPRLSEYIYVFDLPSTDVESIKKMLAVSDAAAVWGSDFAVSGIRSISPSGLQLIEWGHRLSFACVTKKGETPQALEGIAKDICESEQLLCSSPQCVYYEAENFQELVDFGSRLYSALEKASVIFPAQKPEPGVQAEISSLLLLRSLEELMENKKVLRGDGFSVIADKDPALTASPMFRNILVKPMENLFETLRSKKGYLQTAGLACSDNELPGFSDMLCKCGVCRITPCGGMNEGYAGEPHDGRHALSQYTKLVSVKRK